MGHKRRGAREHYSYDEITIKENYAKAFQYMTINGIQSRKDIEELRKSQLAQAKFLTQLDEDNEKQKAEIDNQNERIKKMESDYEQLELIITILSLKDYDEKTKKMKADKDYNDRQKKNK